MNDLSAKTPPLPPEPMGGRSGRTSGSRRGGRLKRVLVWAVCLLVGGLVATELGARFVLGLGDPPLYRLDPEIEYEHVPSRSHTRFGNSFRVNAHSMRSDDFPERKSTPDEVRVMVLGDSIVNGGARIDQADLATEKLRELLKADLGRPVVVGNMSAGSWGPMNELAFVKRHGTFDADVLLIVLNSRDDADVPGLEVIGPQWPTRAPTLAIEELATNYAVRALSRLRGSAAAAPPRSAGQRDMDRASSKAAFLALVELARSRGIRVGVIQHASRSELDKGFEPGHATIGAWALEAGVRVWQLAGAVRGVPGGADAAYLPRDDAHLSAAGQRALAEVLREAARELLAAEGKTSP